jgi:hypothetical protein
VKKKLGRAGKEDINEIVSKEFVSATRRKNSKFEGKEWVKQKVMLDSYMQISQFLNRMKYLKLLATNTNEK